MTNLNLAPVVLLTYRRLQLLKQTVACLKANNLAVESELFIFSDGPKNEKEIADVSRVRNYIKTIKGFKSIEIHISENNKGLAASMKYAVNKTFEKYDRVIVLEDDIICSKDFLTYCNSGLRLYEKNPKIFSLTGYKYPFKIPENYKSDTFLMPRSCSWGWASWKDRWIQIDWETDYYELLKTNSYLRKKFILECGNDWVHMARMRRKGIMDVWSDYWNYTHFKNGAYSLAPKVGKANHLGFDDFAVNEKHGTSILKDLPLQENSVLFDLLPWPDKQILDEISFYFGGTRWYNLKREIRTLTGWNIVA